MTSSRFAMATHILTLLALSDDGPMTSETIAASVDTNPVVIRRTLAGLREAGIVTSQPGSGGGWRLAGPPTAITLCDVFRAVESEQVLPLHPRSPQGACVVGRSICRALEGVFDAAEAAMIGQLATVTIADVMRRATPATR